MEPRKLAAEFVGTALLVIFAVGTATLTFGFKLAGTSTVAGVTTTAFAFGLVLLALVYVFGPISGCHVNPAVTIGFVVARRMTLRDAVGYWTAEFVGGIVGALVLWAVFGGAQGYSRKTTGLGADGWGEPLDDRPQRRERVRSRSRADVLVRARRVDRHELRRVSELRRPCDRYGAHGRAPVRHPPHRHVGESGPQPRSGARRGRRRAAPGVVVHRRTARGRHRRRARDSYVFVQTPIDPLVTPGGVEPTDVVA